MTIESQVINTTNNSIITINVHQTDLWIMIALVIATFAGAGATFLLARQSKNLQQKENDRAGMLHIFGLLSNETNRKMRYNVYKLYCSDEGFNTEGKIKEKKNDLYLTDVENARTIFGQVGRLVKDGYVPKKIFLDTFAGVVIRIWLALEKNIELERNLRHMSRYMETFEYIFNESVEHWKKYYPNDPFPNPCGEKTKEVIKRELKEDSI